MNARHLSTSDIINYGSKGFLYGLFAAQNCSLSRSSNMTCDGVYSVSSSSLIAFFGMLNDVGSFYENPGKLLIFSMACVMGYLVANTNMETCEENAAANRSRP